MAPVSIPVGSMTLPSIPALAMPVGSMADASSPGWPGPGASAPPLPHSPDRLPIPSSLFSIPVPSIPIRFHVIPCQPLPWKSVPCHSFPESRPWPGGHSPPHPSQPLPSNGKIIHSIRFHASPFHVSRFHASPFHGSRFHVNPCHANRFHGSPFQSPGQPSHSYPCHSFPDRCRIAGSYWDGRAGSWFQRAGKKREATRSRAWWIASRCVQQTPSYASAL